MAAQPQRTRPYVLTADEFEEVTEPNVLQADDVEDVPPVPPQTWADRLGLNAPTDSMARGFLRGAGGAAVDMAQGAASRVTGLMDQKLKADQAGVEALPAPANSRSLPRREMPAGLVTDAPPNTAGTVGTYLPDVAAMAAPVGAAVKTGINAIPSAARAGQKFQSVMSAAKDIPVDVNATGDVALRIMQLADRGGTMPIAVRKLLNRVTDPAKAPMVYEEARDFASNISRLSVNEFGRLTPAVAREVANLRVSLNEAVAQAAKQAGKMAEYKSAMREYSQAMRLKDAMATVVTGAKKGVPLATAGGVSYWLTRKVISALGGTE